MPTKRKGAAAKDKNEAPPVKKSKEAKETPENSKAENIEAKPKEASGAFFPRTMKRHDYCENVLCAINNCEPSPLIEDFPPGLLKTMEEFPEFDFFLEEYREAIRVGYEAYFVDEIASGKKKSYDEWQRSANAKGQRTF